MEKKERIFIFSIGIVLMGIFTFTDLQISMALFTKNLYGRVFEVVGELPFLFLSLFGTVLLLRFRSKKNIVINGVLAAVLGFLSVAFASMGGFMTWNYLCDNIGELPQWIAFVIGGVLLLGAAFSAYRLPEKSAHKAVTFGIIALIYFVLVIVVMNTLKATWGRMRIREMTQPLEEFTRWYIITPRGGFDNAYASFPSGHTMNSAAVILSVLLPSFVPILAGREKQLKIFSYTWLILVGTSRIVMGAHFATDVTAGLMLSLFLFEITRMIVCKLRKNNLTEVIGDELEA